MQNLDVISVNLWQILVSVCNLLLLLWIVKKFLYGPVKEVLAKRQNSIDDLYAQAKEAKDAARSCQMQYEEKLANADGQAQLLVKNAVDKAKAREEEIVHQAKENAEGILRQAEAEAQLEKKKAQSQIKQEIVEVSSKLAEKILEREISAEDHKDLIDSFLNNIGDENGGN